MDSKEINITLTEKEHELVVAMVEGYISEWSPTPDEDMRSLAIKLKISPDDLEWIDKMLNKFEGINREDAE